jgi:hypothetical protein
MSCIFPSSTRYLYGAAESISVYCGFPQYPILTTLGMGFGHHVPQENRRSGIVGCHDPTQLLTLQLTIERVFLYIKVKYELCVGTSCISPCPLWATTTAISVPNTSRTASIAGASSPCGEGSKWWVEFIIGNYRMSVSAQRQNQWETYRLTLESNTAPHVCELGPGPISTFCQECQACELPRKKTDLT